MRAKTDAEVTVLHIDFVENFSTICHDEIQPAHWSKKQKTIFIPVTW